MCFSFHHLKVDYKDGQKWVLTEPDYAELKRLFRTWQEGMERGGGWNAVFWCNHDQPRIVSRFGDEGTYWKESAKMLATAIHLMRGTPYIFQGEELGMTNAGFQEIASYRDVESLNYYRILQEEGKTEEEALTILGARSRDNGRTPMQWNAGPHAGFTQGEPWISVTDNYETINAEAERRDPDSIFHYYQKLIALRKQLPVIAEGGIRFLETGMPDVMAYVREDGTDTLLVVCSFAGEERIVTSMGETWAEDPEAAEMILANYGDGGESSVLRPFETRVYRKMNDGYPLGLWPTG